MDFDVSDEQMLLCQSVSQYLVRFYTFDERRAIIASERGTSPEVWSQLEEFGLLALPFPETVGGLGGTMTDVVAIAELFGEHLMSEPYLSSVILAGRALEAAGDNEIAREWLHRIIRGGAWGAFAHEEGRGTADPASITTTATRGTDGYVLSGEKRLVVDGGGADVIVVTARLGGAGHVADELGLVLVAPDAKGLSYRRFRTIDGRGAADCVFDDVPVVLLVSDAAAVITSILEGAVLALSAEAVGAMGALMDVTASYAATRRQFGVPIGSFQAVAHRLADMKIALVKARSTLLYTTALVEAGHAAPRDVSLLKAQVGRLGRSVAESAVQVHGGVGTTDEAVIGHYLKRILTIDAMFGDSDYHLGQVGAR